MPCEYSNLTVTPDHLDFETNQGSPYIPPMQDLFIKKDSHALPAAWDIITDQPWLSVRPMYGRAAKRLRVHVDPRGLKVGAWVGTITVASHVTVTPSVVAVYLTIKGEPEPEPKPEPGPQPTPPQPTPPGPEPQPEPEPEPPPQPPEQESWLARFWKWLRELFGGA